MIQQITLPWPPAKLHGHANGHWREKAKITKKVRDLVSLEAKAQAPAECPSQVLCHFREIWMPDRRKRDILNVLAACKPAIDGLADALCIPGDDWTCFQPVIPETLYIDVDKENPRIVIEIESVRFGGVLFPGSSD